MLIAQLGEVFRFLLAARFRGPEALLNRPL